MKRLAIDDRRIFREAYQCLGGYEGLQKLKEGGPWDELFLDNDLGMGELEGIDIARFLEIRAEEGNKIEIGKVYIVTSNPVAAREIELTLSRHYDCQRLSMFDMLDNDLIEYIK